MPARQKPATRQPRPRSSNAPTPALTVDYGRVPRNEMDAFTVGGPPSLQWEHLALTDAETIKQFEYLAQQSYDASAHASTSVVHLRQSRSSDYHGSPTARYHGVPARPAAQAPSRTHGVKGVQPGRQDVQVHGHISHDKSAEGGRSGCCGRKVTCALMLLALATQPALAQMVGEPVTKSTEYDAHSKGAGRADGDVRHCARGSHRTSGDVTTAGDGTCRFPRRAHAVEDKDHFGKLIAPLHSHEFVLESENGAWGRWPRHIARNDPKFFHHLHLSHQVSPHAPPPLTFFPLRHTADGDARFNSSLATIGTGAIR